MSKQGCKASIAQIQKLVDNEKRDESMALFNHTYPELGKHFSKTSAELAQILYLRGRICLLYFSPKNSFADNLMLYVQAYEWLKVSYKTNQTNAVKSFGNDRDKITAIVADSLIQLHELAIRKIKTNRGF